MIAEDLHRQARAALTAWASLVDPDTLTPMPTVTNPLWRVDGPGPALVLKQLPQHPPGVTPVVQYRVLSYLRSQGVPVAQPLLTDDGTLHTTVHERQWTLLPYLPNDTDTVEIEPDATATAIGAAIGNLDRVLGDYPWPVESFVDDPIKVVTEDLPELPGEVVRLVEPFTEELRESCIDLPTQLTHGDCNHGNVLLHHGTVSGFLDLDHLPTGPRVRDLAYYLASRLTAQLNQTATADAATAAMTAVFADYVNGYHETYPLTEQERRAVVPLMMITEIAGAHWSLHGWEPSTDRYRRSLRSMTWISRHFADLARSSRG